MIRERSFILIGTLAITVAARYGLRICRFDLDQEYLRVLFVGPVSLIPLFMKDFRAESYRVLRNIDKDLPYQALSDDFEVVAIEPEVRDLLSLDLTKLLPPCLSTQHISTVCYTLITANQLINAPP